jgi:CHRD domain-containing protein
MRTTLVLVALAGLLVAAAPATAKVKRLETSLKGSSASDTDGSGTAKLRLDAAKKRVCFTIRVKNVDDVFAAHIHAGGKNVANGSIVVDLITSAAPGPKFTGCTKNVRKALIRKILKHPRRYYVNVHTMEFPGGAVRGQLHKP